MMEGAPLTSWQTGFVNKKPKSGGSSMREPERVGRLVHSMTSEAL